MPAEGVYISPEGRKTFIPLENNPDVFTSLVHSLGVSPDLGFYDVYSLDDADLLSLVPRPTFALIFITPPAMYRDVRREDNEYENVTGRIGSVPLTYDKSGDQESVMWFQQTIGHACGLHALLHSVANGEARRMVTEGSMLDKLLKQTKPQKPTERAKTLYDSEELEDFHMRAARTGNSNAPSAEDPVGYHFIAFVKGDDGHLWELEGCTDGPLDRGALKEGDDMLSEDALNKGVRRFLKFSNGDLNFSIVALAKQPTD